MGNTALNIVDRNQRYGALVAVDFVGSDKQGRLWRFRCDCGVECTRSVGAIRRALDGNFELFCSNRCPLASVRRKTRPHQQPQNFIDLTGKVFGVLTVLRRHDTQRVGSMRMHRTRWWVLCACGRERAIPASKLKKYCYDECVCHLTVARNRKHGRPEYNSWNNARDRCRNPRSKNYPAYGGRGIEFCPEWDDFFAFLRDVGPRPSPGHSLDRIDPNGNYEPGNVRWSTRLEQNNNKRLSEQRVRSLLDQAAEQYGDCEMLAFLRAQLLGA